MYIIPDCPNLPDSRERGEEGTEDIGGGQAGHHGGQADQAQEHLLEHLGDTGTIWILQFIRVSFMHYF